VGNFSLRELRSGIGGVSLWAGGLFSAVVFLSAIAPTAAGQNDEFSHKSPFSQEEYETLPRYCWASNMINKGLADPLLSEEERKKWYDQMGQDFIHIHHWCWGLMQMRRGNQTRDPVERNRHYKTAIANFDYVIRASSSTFPLKPEFHLRKGITLRLMGNDAAAAGEFGRAIKLKPDYTPAYSALADLHVDLGNTSEAMNVLEAGLRQAPDSRILAQKKAELQSLSAARQNQR
jgi:tetratricopeptide (TPR) repeat protein